jgi:hypothetical protein
VFAADFYPDGSLYPAARPAQRQTVPAFVARMQGLAAARLRSFEEGVLGSEVHVFGNIAVALAACEMTENGVDANRGVEALLLIKRCGIVANRGAGVGFRERAQANSSASRRRQGSGVTASQPGLARPPNPVPAMSARTVAATAHRSSLVIFEPSTERSPIKPF